MSINYKGNWLRKSNSELSFYSDSLSDTKCLCCSV